MLQIVKRRDVLRADRRIDLRALGHPFLCDTDWKYLGGFDLKGPTLKNSAHVASSPLRFFGNERRFRCHGQGFRLTRWIFS